jgi:hypothetical protein
MCGFDSQRFADRADGYQQRASDEQYDSSLHASSVQCRGRIGLVSMIACRGLPCDLYPEWIGRLIAEATEDASGVALI